MPKPINLAAALAAEAGPMVQRLTLNELVEAYFARNPTADGEYRVRKWLDAFGDRDAWSLAAEDLERAAEYLLAAGYAPGSVNRDLGVLGSAYRWARRRRLCPRGFTNPTLAVRRYPEPLRRVHIDDATLEALRAGAIASRSPGFGAFVSALIDSGARKGEVVERCWQDFDPEDGTLTALKTKTGVPRVLFLQPRTTSLIKCLRSTRTVLRRGYFVREAGPRRPLGEVIPIPSQIHLFDLVMVVLPQRPSRARTPSCRRSMRWCERPVCPG